MEAGSHSRIRSFPARHDPAHERAGRAAGGQPGPRRDRVRGPDRRGHGVHPRSGIAPLSTRSETHCQRGRPLRVLTTTYTGSTEARALDALRDSARRSGCRTTVTNTRLHAKAWLFSSRDSGFSTAYVGSSNLTHSAQITGLEWNVRVSGARNPDVVDKIAAVFESYWNSGDFVPYDAGEFAGPRPRLDGHRRSVCLSPVELRAEPFQEATARADRARRASTATIATCWSPPPARARPSWRRSTTPGFGDAARARLLFVAHREEILEQSLATFRHALRDQRSASCGSAARDRSPSSTSSPRSRASTPARSTPRRRITSTSSSSTSSITPRRPSTNGCSSTSSRRSCWGSPRRRSAATALPSCIGSTIASRPSSAVGRDRPASPGAVRLLRHPRRARSARDPWRRGRATTSRL